MGHAKCPIDGGERRSRLPTFHLLLSSPPTSSGLYQPAQSVSHPRNYHVVITTNIRAKGMAELLEGSVGKYAERGRKTAWGRCEEIRAVGLTSLASTQYPHHMNAIHKTSYMPKRRWKVITRFPANVSIHTTHESDGYVIPWLRSRFASASWAKVGSVNRTTSWKPP